MAKLKLIGDVVVLQSEKKYSDYELVGKYRPEALILRDESGDAEFAVSVRENAGEITPYSVTFDSKTRDEAGYALISIPVSGIPRDLDASGIKEFICDRFYTTVANVEKIEAKISSVIDEITSERNNLIGSIELA